MALGTGTNYRKEWPFTASNGDWRIVRQADVRPGEEALYDPVWLPQRLRAAVHEEFARRTLLDLSAELWSAGGVRKSSWPQLSAKLVEEFRKRTLALVRPPVLDTRPGSGGAKTSDRDNGNESSPRNSAGSAASSTKQKLTWVSFRLVDESSLPVASEAYRIVLPDGSTRDGTLNSAGEAWFEDIPVGDCQISFPNLDARDWKPV